MNRCASSRGSSRKKTFLVAASACLVLVLSYYGFLTARNAFELLSVFRPQEALELGQGDSDAGGSRRAEILKRLNEEIDQESATSRKEETHLLARLDQLLKSLQAYLLPAKEKQEAPVQSARRGQQESGEVALSAPTAEETLGGRPSRDEEAVEKALQLALNPSVAAPGAIESRTASDRSVPRDIRPLLETPLQSPEFSYGQEEGSSPHWLRRIEPLEAYRARGMILRLHRILSLEGLVDTSPVGETDPDLHDFGIRSVQALTFLQGEPRPVYYLGSGKIESGYPRSFGIGVNFRLSPTVNFLFDYHHESPNDHIIEYRGNWESSLVTDYAKIRPESEDTIHSFFFGLRYLYYKDRDQLIPLQTGFFYSTNMADEPLSSDVSLGFGIGGGFYRQGMRLALAYRLRIWENPTVVLLENREEDLAQRISNQFMFSLSF